MGTVKVLPPDWATQRAFWRSHDELAFIAVNMQSVKDDRGASGWSWEIAAPVSDGIGMHYTSTPADYMYGWDNSLGMLETLSSFLNAWVDAIDWSDRNGSLSENAGIFPASCEGILPYVDEFVCDIYDHTERA